MPPEGKIPGSPADWLRHAASDLSLSRVTRPPGVLFEDLCFHAQQATEKALKAILVAKSIPVPRTHNIRTLLDFIPTELSMPPEAQDAALLTDYAVSSRYPGDLGPVDEDEYIQAIHLAEVIVQWAEGIIRKIG